MRKTTVGVAVAAFAMTMTMATVGAMAGATAADDPTPSPNAQSPSTTASRLEQVSALTAPSVVYISASFTAYVYDTFNKRYLNDGYPFTETYQCTGYVVNPDGYIATAGHCVNPNSAKPDLIRDAAQWALDNGYYASTTLDLQTVLGFDDYQVRNSDEKRNKVDRDVTAAWGVSAGGVQTGKALPARVLKWESESAGDGAVLKVEERNLNAIPLTDEILDVGKEVVAVGYPVSVDLVTDATFSPSFKEGAVSSVKTVNNGLLTVYEISAAVSGGMSGGPVVDLDGEVVGFNSFKISSELETQQFNFVRPSSIIEEILADIGTSNDLSAETTAYRDGLRAYFDGDKTTAVAKLQQVADAQPTNEFAAKYLTRAKALPDPPPPEEDEASGGDVVLGLLILGLIGAVFVGGIALLVVLLRRKGSRPTAPAAPAMAGPGPAGQPVMAPGSAPGSPSTATSAPPAGPTPSAPPAPTATPTPAAPVTPTPAPSPAPTPATGPTTTQTSAPKSESQQEGQREGQREHDVYCPNCGAHHDQGQKFCVDCGTAL